MQAQELPDGDVRDSDHVSLSKLFQGAGCTGDQIAQYDRRY